jgi:hypothetical protein
MRKNKIKGDVVMIKLIGTLLSMILSPMGAMESLCEPIAKLLAKIFWFTAFTGFNTNDDAIEQIDKKLEEKHAKCRENETFRKVEDGLEKTIGFVEQLIFDVIMILCTAGLWIFWMMIRKRRNNKKNNKRA